MRFGRTDGQTDRRTNPHIEMLGRIEKGKVVECEVKRNVKAKLITRFIAKTYLQQIISMPSPFVFEFKNVLSTCAESLLLIISLIWN